MSLQTIAFSHVSNYVRNDFQTIDGKETVSSLLSTFYKTERYELLVQNKNRIEVVTLRDVLKVDHPDQTSISKISKPLPSVLSSASVAEAIDMMVKNKIRTIRVFNDREIFIGLVLQTDLLNELADIEELKNLLAHEVMVKSLITAEVDISAATVRSMMIKNNISHIPLISKEGLLKGLITAQDLVWYFIHPRESLGLGDIRGEKIKKWSSKISGIEDKNPITASSGTSLYNVIQMIIENKKSCCLITEDRKLLGIITPREILALLKEFRPK